MSAPRILYVTGKGGVGKTTVTAALALNAARRGLRTIVAEPAGAARLPEIFRVPGQGYTPTRLAEGLYSISITPEEAMEEYVVQQIRFRRLYRMVFRNRVMGPFVDGVPGLHDGVTLGKVFDLERSTTAQGRTWDLILVDAPATGHGLSLLSSARSMMNLTRVGPLYEGNRMVDERISDPAVTGIILVALPEELPVSETIELWRSLGDRQGQARLCVLNRCMEDPVPPGVQWTSVRSSVEAASPAGGELVGLMDRLVLRHQRQATATARLDAALPCPIVRLPTHPTPTLSTHDLDSLGTPVADAVLGPGGAG